jgi:hypothetical protein
VDVGDRHRFLVVRREVEKSRVLDAVKRSLMMVPQLRRWLDWKGIPAVSIVVSLNQDAALTGRIDTMLVRWFPQRAAVGKLLFHTLSIDHHGGESP